MTSSEDRIYRMTRKKGNNQTGNIEELSINDTKLPRNNNLTPDDLYEEVSKESTLGSTVNGVDLSELSTSFYVAVEDHRGGA